MRTLWFFFFFLASNSDLGVKFNLEMSYTLPFECLWNKYGLRMISEGQSGGKKLNYFYKVQCSGF